jgi:hypothetical protein
MKAILEFFKILITNYGATFSILFLLLMIILFGIYFIIKTFPDIIREYAENKFEESNHNHLQGINKRKYISSHITKILSDLLIDTQGDRALLLEFSNGNSNLVGLPFLFLSATIECLNDGVSSVAHLYQRINVSLFAKFLENLEDKGYFYFNDIEDIKDNYSIIYNLMKPNSVKSGLFYSIYGVDDTLGFIVVTSVTNSFTREDILPRVAESAQMICALLNYKDLKDEIK